MNGPADRQGHLDREPRNRGRRTKRPKRDVETPSYIEMVRRIIRAAGTRAGAADEVELGLLIGLRAEVDAAINRAVADQLDRGVTWRMIGIAAGTTKQAAQARWGHLRQGDAS